MILVTGASGFIGKHLLAALVKQYGSQNIVALTSIPIKESRYLLHNNYNFDSDYLLESGYAAIHTVIHAGAFTPKNASEINHVQGCASNIINTLNLLQLNLPSLKKFIFLSTLDVYSSDECISESTPVAPVSLYGQSKLYCEKMIEAWGLNTQVSVQVLRVGHIYGPGEEAYQKLIPLLLLKLLKNQSIQVHGSGEEKRSFLFIDDLVSAICRAAQLETNPGVINLVGGRSITVKELVNMLIKVSGKQATIEHVPSAGSPRNLVFDNSKMKRELTEEKVDLEAGLRIEWNYLKYLSDENLL